MSRALSFVFIIIFSVSAFGQTVADVACGPWKSMRDGHEYMGHTTVGTTVFDAIPDTACDIVVSTSGTAGIDNAIFSEDTATALTVDGIAYTQYVSEVPDVVAIPSVGGPLGSERLIFVRVTNNDGVPRDVDVTLVWGSE